MKVLVPVKRVVDYNVKVRVKSDGSGVDIASSDSVKVITVRTTGFDPAAATGGSASVETANAKADSGKSSFLGQKIAKSDRPELTAAKIIVSGGRALGSSEKFHEVLEPLADKLGAALGASRAAVDAGYAPAQDFPSRPI